MIKWILWGLALVVGLVIVLTGAASWKIVFVWLVGLFILRWIVYRFTMWALTRRPRPRPRPRPND